MRFVLALGFVGMAVASEYVNTIFIYICSAVSLKVLYCVISVVEDNISA
jgi:hypothetical protein